MVEKARVRNGYHQLYSYCLMTLLALLIFLYFTHTGILGMMD
jgi:hypothetical protein